MATSDVGQAVPRALDPLGAASAITDAYLAYVRTAFPLRRPPVAEAFERLVHERGLLWSEPYVSLSRPAALGASFHALVEEDVLHEGTAGLAWGFPRLFAHQEAATRRLAGASRRNTLLATGTGSGKTEAFLIPVIDSVLRDPAPGLRAVILYPMNALANDQLGRLRRLLADCPEVTFGRYTGDTPESDDAAKGGRQRPGDSPPNERYTRREMRASPPHILLTGYAMLEQLLLRERDRTALFGAGALRFLVVDEVHTYTGITGAEVACLVRRLKAHAGLSEGALTCVATSATVRRGAGTDEDLARFAGALFGERFEDDAIVVERPADLPEMGEVPPIALGLDDELIRQAAVDEEALSELAYRLTGERVERDGWSALAGHPLIVETQRTLDRPRGLSDLVEAMRRWPGRADAEDADLRREALGILTLGAAARATDDPIVRPKIHLLVRSLLPVRRCLDDECGRLSPEGEPACSSPRHGDASTATLPLASCRECGQDYWTTTEDLNRELAVESDDDGTPRETLLVPAGVSLTAADIDEDERITLEQRDVCMACGTVIAPGAGCRCGASDDRRVTLRTFFDPTLCPACGASSRQGRPVIAPFRSGQNATVSVLAQHLMGALDPTTRRLLVFADSRQDAAQQAGYMRDRSRDFTVRQVTLAAVGQLESEDGPPTADRLGREVLRYAEERFGETAAFNLLFPPDAIGVRDVSEQGFLAPDEVVPRWQRAAIEGRLDWDIANELGPRSLRRVSLPREGLIGVEYDRLDEVAGDDLDELRRLGLSASSAVELLSAVLDVMRWRRMIAYEGFQQFLGPWIPLVEDGAVPEVSARDRTPVALGEVADSKPGGYVIRGAFSPGGALMRMAAKVLGGSATTETRERAVRTALQILDRRGYVRRHEIGSRGRRFGKKASGWQVERPLMVVRSRASLWRCDRCGATRAYRLRDRDSKDVCANGGCRGTPSALGSPPGLPHAGGRDYYRRLYEEGEPLALAALEHSGQVPSERREQIEHLFNENRLNLLCCTPTLELGVDIGDLEAVLMRNIPPLPSNYAQRAGRAGRRRQVALVVSHAGQGSHDSHFYAHPEEMITGEITPPQIELGNRVVVRRHLNSLILEELPPDAFPGDWESLLTGDGRVDRGKIGEARGRLAKLLADDARRTQIVGRMRDAFMRPTEAGGIPGLGVDALGEAIAELPDQAMRALERWADRHDDLNAQLDQIPRRAKGAEERLERRLRRALELLEQDRDFKPRAFLARAGVLPRYGFVGDTVSIRDDRQREATQSAAIAIAEYAPGNAVYALGRKLKVSRVLFSGGERREARENATEYRYCGRCSFATEDREAAACAECGDYLIPGHYAPLEAVEGRPIAAIRSDEEYRSRSWYDIAHALGVPESAPSRRAWADWVTDLSRGRSVDMYNRGRREASGEVSPFKVCLRCGGVAEGPGRSRDDGGRPAGHAGFCDVRTWDDRDDERIEPQLHLRASVRGDVLELHLPGPLAAEHVMARRGEPSFALTLAESLKLGLARERQAGAGEVDFFIARRGSEEAPSVAITFYDQLPGGTGYLPWMQERLGAVALAAWRHLDECPCESSCYRCLREFWNQRHHEQLDKRLVMRHLLVIAGVSESAAMEMPALKAALFDSFLEVAFWRLLEESDLPRPTVQRLVRSPDGRRIATADFAWGDVLVFVDGYEYHAADPRDARGDIKRRSLLADEGKRVVELAYEDVVGHPERTLREIAASIDSSATAHADGADALLIDGQRVPVASHDLARGRVIVDAQPEEWSRDRARWREDLARNRLLATAELVVIREELA